MKHLLLTLSLVASIAHAADRVAPQPFKAQAKDGKLALSLPAKSVLVIEVQQ